MRICDAAAEVLKETNNPAVTLEDCGLLDLIAKRAGVIAPPVPFGLLHQKIINALAKQPGILTKYYTRTAHGKKGRKIRGFRFPEEPNNGD